MCDNKVTNMIWRSLSSKIPNTCLTSRRNDEWKQSSACACAHMRLNAERLPCRHMFLGTRSSEDMQRSHPVSSWQENNTLIWRLHPLILRHTPCTNFRILKIGLFQKPPLGKMFHCNWDSISVYVHVCVVCHFSTLTSRKSLKLLCKFMHVLVIGLLIQDQIHVLYKKQALNHQKPTAECHRDTTYWEKRVISLDICFGNKFL